MKFLSDTDSQLVYLLFLRLAIWLLCRAMLGFFFALLVALAGG